MIDARFIEAKRRAAKNNAGETPGNSRRRRQGQRGGDRAAETVSPPTKPVDPPSNENINLQRDKNPHSGNHVIPRMSPQSQPSKPTDTVPIIRKHGQGGQNATSIVKPTIPIGSLETATSNLSIRDDIQPPKQGRQRNRNRGRSNMVKHSSPQRTFHGRTSSEEPRSVTNRLSMGSRPDMGVDLTQRGVLPISVQPPAPRVQENASPVVRLPDVVPAPVSHDSRDTNNLIRSEDTDFGSDISRGAIQEGRLYSYRPVASPSNPKPREQQKPDHRPQEDKSEQPQRGVLRIQPGKLEQPKQQPPGHRGGLLFIDTNVIKSPNKNTTKPKPKPRGNQSSEFNRNIIPLRNDNEPQSRVVWNPDNIPSRVSPNSVSSHSGAKLVVTPDDILREVKLAYQEIQNLERKIKACYESQDEGLEMSRMQRRPTSDAVSWTAYTKTHQELLEYYHTFFIMTQHPSAPSNVRRLPKRHDVLARYWKYGIVQLLEFLRQKLPQSEAHMHGFIFGAYALTGLLLQDVPVFQAIWMECLGDLARYLYGIEENDMEDREHWKDIAKEWYLKTIDVSHGMEGRLFHHIGILSKDDQLLQMFYFAKSLTVVRGFSSARESFLILIDPILGKRGNTWSDVFVRLHGMLFARLSLDSFDDELDTFFEVFGDSPPLPVQWARLAVINIAAIYQYNRRDSLLKESLRQGRREKREADLEETVPAEEVADGDAILPTSHADNVQMDLANIVPAGKFTNIPFDVRSDDHEDVSLSNIVFEKSCLLAFSLLSEVLNAGLSEIFVHVWLVFLAYSLRYQPVVRLLERKIPWQELVEFLNEINDDIQIDSASTLSLDDLAGPVLLEDPIMRGFEWSRKVFPKGWFQDVDPTVELEDPTAGSNERKHRILSLGIQISKICDCIEFDDMETTFRMSEAVKARIAAAEAKDAEEAERLEQAAQAAREAALNDSLIEAQPVHGESDEDADDPGENEEIRALKARRRELKALLKAQRPDAKHDAMAKQSKKDKTSRKAVKFGYTTLVFDTNLLVSHLDLLKQVVENGDRQIVVPLIVINELDGLKVNPAPLGPAASEAVAFIEQALSERKIRVVTQQGNGLSNLAFRSQQLLSKTTEDGAGNIDAFIIETVKDQAERHSGKLQNVEKAVLVTGDRSMRVISKARGVQAMTAAELRKEILKNGDKSPPDRNRKRAWG